MCTGRHKSPHSHGVPNLHILQRLSLSPPLPRYTATGTPLLFPPTLLQRRGRSSPRRRLASPRLASRRFEFSLFHSRRSTSYPPLLRLPLPSAERDASDLCKLSLAIQNIHPPCTYLRVLFFCAVFFAAATVLFQRLKATLRGRTITGDPGSSSFSRRARAAKKGRFRSRSDDWLTATSTDSTFLVKCFLMVH